MLYAIIMFQREEMSARMGDADQELDEHCLLGLARPGPGQDQSSYSMTPYTLEDLPHESSSSL